MKASVGVLSKVDASDINLKDSYSKSHRQHLIQTVTPHLNKLRRADVRNEWALEASSNSTEPWWPSFYHE